MTADLAALEAFEEAMPLAIEAACKAAPGGRRGMNALELSELATLARQINDEHRQATDAMSVGLGHAVMAGQLLIEAKSKVPHGEWLPWLEANCETSERTAQGYMRLATRWPELAKAQRVADLPMRDALKMLAAPKEVEAAAPAALPVPESTWLERIEWCNLDFPRLRATGESIRRSSDELDKERDEQEPAEPHASTLESSRRLLVLVERSVRQEEVLDAIESFHADIDRYEATMGQAMIEAAADEVYPLWSEEARSKVDGWVAWMKGAEAPA